MAALLADWNVSRIAEFRTLLGLSQVALAERVGISRPTLAKIEEGGSTKLSTINFLVARLEEEFGDQFESIRLVEAGANGYELAFVKKDSGAKVEHLRQVPTWSGELNALSRKIMEVCSAKNAAYLPMFHAELLEILESYEKLSGMEILVKDD
ncbi:MAG: helix-turn-helix domain-containing protein [Siculibacillus sp.]